MIQQKPTYDVLFDLFGALAPAFKELNVIFGTSIEVLTNLAKTDLGAKLIQFVYSEMVGKEEISREDSTKNHTIIDIDTCRPVDLLGINPENPWVLDFTTE